MKSFTGLKMFTALVTALALASCQSPAPVSASNTGTTPKPKIEQENPTPDAPATPEQQSTGSGGTATTGGGGASTGEQTGQEKPKHRNIPARMYQVDDLQTVKLKIGKHEFTAWVMDSYYKRQEGMMFMEDNDFTEKECMIFVFQKAEPQRFWMKNTLVPLDIAYCSANKKILNTYTMRALDVDTDYSSAGPSKYVIEFKAGVFKKLDIKPGAVVEIPDTVKAKD